MPSSETYESRAVELPSALSARQTHARAIELMFPIVQNTRPCYWERFEANKSVLMVARWMRESRDPNGSPSRCDASRCGVPANRRHCSPSVGDMPHFVLWSTYTHRKIQ